MSRNVRRLVGLWLCLDEVEQDAIYELLVHRVRCEHIDGPTDE